MNKHFIGNYNYSIRTSGEAVGLFIREKEVMCILILFIDANLRLIY